MCDTFVAMQSATADGSVIFGKNSDREPNEAQALEYHAGRHISRPGVVKCTYLQIPQVRKTLAVLLCRPFWMWGAEMGANEKGVVIGNEAVFTRMPTSRTGGLTGMDMLRLALERSSTATSAMETIVQLLADYGQGGICGFEDKRMTYHNSFLIADPGEAWVLETAGHLWAARRVKDFHAISNRLTIGRNFDECHPALIDTARTKGWLKKGENFNFALCFSDWFFTTFSASRRRQGRVSDLLRRGKGQTDVPAAVRILRDHGTGPYRPDSHFLGSHVCAHAANKLARNATQTTGSLVAHLKKDNHVFWVTGTAAPCTAVFKPVWLNEKPLPDIGPLPGRRFDRNTLWWHHELLHRGILHDYRHRIKIIARERDLMEEKYCNAAVRLQPDKRPDLTRRAFRGARQATERWILSIQAAGPQSKNRLSYRRYWKLQNKKAGIENKIAG